MKNRRSHELFTNTFFPFLDQKTVREVNHSMDNPSFGDMMLGKARANLMGPNWGFLPSMYTHGHRQANHDMITALMKGVQVGGTQGVDASAGHLMGDMLSDFIAKATSAELRDVLEACYLLANKQRKR